MAGGARVFLGGCLRVFSLYRRRKKSVRRWHALDKPGMSRENAGASYSGREKGRVKTVPGKVNTVPSGWGKWAAIAAPRSLYSRRT